MSDIINLKCCVLPTPTPTPTSSLSKYICVQGLVYDNNTNNLIQELNPGNAVASLNYRELDFANRPSGTGFPGVPKNLANNYQINFYGQTYIDYNSQGQYTFNVIANNGSQYSLRIDGSTTNTAYLAPGLHNINLDYIPGTGSSQVGLRLLWTNIDQNKQQEVVPYNSWECRSPLASQTPTPSNSATPSMTPSNTVTPSITPSNTVTPSITPSNTVTPSITVSNSVTPSITVSNSVTPSITVSNSVTPSPSKPPEINSAAKLGRVLPGNKCIFVEWNRPAQPIAPIVHYEIQYSINNGMSWHTYATYTDITSQIGSYIILGLTNGTSYKIRIGTKYNISVLNNVIYTRNTADATPSNTVNNSLAAHIDNIIPGNNGLNISLASAQNTIFGSNLLYNTVEVSEDGINWYNNNYWYNSNTDSNVPDNQFIISPHIIGSCSTSLSYSIRKNDLLQVFEIYRLDENDTNLYTDSIQKTVNISTGIKATYSSALSGIIDSPIYLRGVSVYADSANVDFSREEFKILGPETPSPINPYNNENVPLAGSPTILSNIISPGTIQITFAPPNPYLPVSDTQFFTGYAAWYTYSGTNYMFRFVPGSINNDKTFIISNLAAGNYKIAVVAEYIVSTDTSFQQSSSGFSTVYAFSSVLNATIP